MASYNIYNKITRLNQDFLSTLDLNSLLDIKNQRTFEETVRRLIEDNVIIQLEKGKYQIAGRTPSDFAVAQFLYNPSYISFETALNYYGILPQFPYEITSATTKKRIKKIIDQKTYSYVHVDKSLFLGYENKDGSLLALPEKALFDQIYISIKGLKSLESIDEMDLSKISKEKLVEYTQLLSLKQKNTVIKIIKQYL